MCERKEEMQVEHIPDGVKVAISAAPPTLTFMGFPMQEWTYVLSAVVSILFIIEKMPTIISRVRTFIHWIKNVKR